MDDAMKEKYSLAEDGFVGYWHPAKGHEGKALIVFPGSGADYELSNLATFGLVTYCCNWLAAVISGLIT